MEDAIGSERGHLARGSESAAPPNRKLVARRSSAAPQEDPLDRPLTGDKDSDVANLRQSQVTMHDHFTAQKLVVAAASQHFVHGKRILYAGPKEETRIAAESLFKRMGVPSISVVETGRQCLRSITVSRRNFESSPLAVDPAFTAPVACSNFDIIFLDWEIEEPSCAAVLESLLAFGKPVDGDMNARLQMPTVIITSQLSPDELPDVVTGLTARNNGSRPRWLNEATHFPLLRSPLQRRDVEQAMQSCDYVAQRLGKPIPKELLDLPEHVAEIVKTTMKDSDAGTIPDNLFTLRRKLRASSARRTRITNSIREIQVAVEAADEAEEVFLEIEPSENSNEDAHAAQAVNEAPQKPLPYRLQGSRRLYTAKALLRRKQIRLNPKVIHGIRLFWMALDNLKDTPPVKRGTSHRYLDNEDDREANDETASISRDAFITFNLKVQKALSKEFQLNEAVLIAEADWERDMGVNAAAGKDMHHDIKKRRMHYDDFFESMFEIADLWCTGVRVREYVVFIHSLLESIARVKFETPTSGSHSNSSAVAKVELKDDAAINHDRFVHDVDKGTVTGTVFREMEIPDDPLDDDVEALLGCVEEESMDIEEIEEGHDDDEASTTSLNTIEKLAAHGQFEIADDEASSDEEEDYASLLQKAEAEAAEAAARLAATQSAGATPQISAPPSRPNTGAARVLFGGSTHGTSRGGGTPRSQSRPPHTAETASEDASELDTDQGNLDNTGSGAATEKRKSKGSKKTLTKAKTRKRKKNSNPKNGHEGKVAEAEEASYVTKDLELALQQQNQQRARQAAAAEERARRQAEIELRAQQALAAAKLAEEQRAEEVREAREAEQAARENELQMEMAQARAALEHRPKSPLPDPDKDASLNALSAAAQAADARAEAVAAAAQAVERAKDLSSTKTVKGAETGAAAAAASTAAATAEEEPTLTSKGDQESVPGLSHSTAEKQSDHNVVMETSAAQDEEPTIDAFGTGANMDDNVDGGRFRILKASKAAQDARFRHGHESTSQDSNATKTGNINHSVKQETAPATDVQAKSNHERKKTEILAFPTALDVGVDNEGGHPATGCSDVLPMSAGLCGSVLAHDSTAGLARLNSDGTINIWVNDGSDGISDDEDNDGDSQPMPSLNENGVDFAGQVPQLTLDTLSTSENHSTGAQDSARLKITPTEVKSAGSKAIEYPHCNVDPVFEDAMNGNDAGGQNVECVDQVGSNNAPQVLRQPEATSLYGRRKARQARRRLRREKASKHRPATTGTAARKKRDIGILRHVRRRGSPVHFLDLERKHKEDIPAEDPFDVSEENPYTKRDLPITERHGMQWAEGATGSRGGSFGGPFNFSASPVNIDEDEIGVPRERRETTVIFNQADGKGVNITYNRSKSANLAKPRSAQDLRCVQISEQMIIPEANPGNGFPTRPKARARPMSAAILRLRGNRSKSPQKRPSSSASQRHRVESRKLAPSSPTGRLSPKAAPDSPIFADDGEGTLDVKFLPTTAKDFFPLKPRGSKDSPREEKSGTALNAFANHHKALPARARTSHGVLRLSGAHSHSSPEQDIDLDSARSNPGVKPRTATAISPRNLVEEIAAQPLVRRNKKHTGPGNASSSRSLPDEIFRPQTAPAQRSSMSRDSPNEGARSPPLARPASASPRRQIVAPLTSTTLVMPPVQESPRQRRSSPSRSPSRSPVQLSFNDSVGVGVGSGARAGRHGAGKREKSMSSSNENGVSSPQNRSPVANSGRHGLRSPIGASAYKRALPTVKTDW